MRTGCPTGATFAWQAQASVWLQAGAAGPSHIWLPRVEAWSQTPAWPCLISPRLLVGFLLMHHGYAAPVCVHRIRQVRRLGLPARAPSMATTRVSTSTPNVTHELTVAPSCTATAAFSACCCTRSA